MLSQILLLNLGLPLEFIEDRPVKVFFNDFHIHLCGREVGVAHGPHDVYQVLTTGGHVGRKSVA